MNAICVLYFLDDNLTHVLHCNFNSLVTTCIVNIFSVERKWLILILQQKLNVQEEKPNNELSHSSECKEKKLTEKSQRLYKYINILEINKYSSTETIKWEDNRTRIEKQMANFPNMKRSREPMIQRSWPLVWRGHIIRWKIHTIMHTDSVNHAHR